MYDPIAKMPRKDDAFERMYASRKSDNERKTRNTGTHNARVGRRLRSLEWKSASCRQTERGGGRGRLARPAGSPGLVLALNPVELIGYGAVTASAISSLIERGTDC